MDKIFKKRGPLDSGRNMDPNLISAKFGLVTPEESLTLQSEKDEADINLLVKRFGVVGLAERQVRRPTYGDFTGVSNYQEAMNALIAANESFMKMPATVRERFHNDPAEFVEFCSNEENLEELREMGLADKVVEPEVTLADVVQTLKETRYGDDGPVDPDARAAQEAPRGGSQGDRGAAPSGVRGSAAERPGVPNGRR